jgi:hypothetical protein
MHNHHQEDSSREVLVDLMTSEIMNTQGSSREGDFGAAHLPSIPASGESRSGSATDEECARNERRGEPQHGVDYVTDFYAVLGVLRDADADAIKSAFREKVKGVNPNKLQGTDYEKDGQRRLAVLVLAKDTLIDPKGRAAYDELLDSFPAELRSKTGTPIISSSSAGLDIKQLLGGSTVPDIRAIHNLVPGSNPEMLEVLKELHERAPSVKTARALREALSCALAAAMIEEDFAWLDSGVGRPDDPKVQLRPDALIDARQRQIAEVRKKLPQVIESHLLAGSEIASLLLPAAKAPTDEVVANPEQQSMAIQLKRATDVALARFEQRAEDLLLKAEQRIAITNEIVTLTEWHYIGGQVPQFGRLMVLMVDSGQGADVVKASFDCSLREGAIDMSRIDDFDGLSRDVIESDQFSETCKALREALQADIAVFYRCSEVSFGLELDYVLQQHFRSITSEELEQGSTSAGLDSANQESP